MMNPNSNKSISSIVNFVKSGEKHSSQQTLGVEVEHIIVDADGNSVPYTSNDNQISIRDIMIELGQYYDNVDYGFEDDGTKYPVELKRDDAVVSMEPGGQLEVALSPMNNIEEIEKSYSKFIDEVNEICAKYKYQLLHIGYRPDLCALEIPITQKNRYRCMNNRFRCINTHGPCMMRNTASTQVSIDFNDENDCARKFKVAHALAPLIYFLFDNSPIFEKTFTQTVNEKYRLGRGTYTKDTKTPSGLFIPKRMARYIVWNNTDDDRTGAIKTAFENFSYENYAKSALLVPLIYARSKQKNLTNENIATKIGEDLFYGPYSAADAACKRALTKDEVEHILSMGFHDARLKNFIEIRSADCVPPKYLFAYVALIKGIFYNSHAFNIAFDMFKTITHEDYIDACSEIYENGWKANIYNSNPQKIWTELLNAAHNSLDSKEARYLDVLDRLVDRKIVVWEDTWTTDSKIFRRLSSFFSPISETFRYSQIQLDYYHKTNGDMLGRKSAYKIQKNSKAIHDDKIVKLGYITKVFDKNDYLLMSDIVSTSNKIFEKIVNHYYENSDYAALFGFDEFEKRLINFRPKYKSAFPIGRLDVFYNDETGAFEFCEFNTAGSSAMDDVSIICKDARQFSSFKVLEKKLNKKGKTAIDFDLFSPWIEEFVNIYNEWCSNTGRTQITNDGTCKFAIVDFLDTCAIHDFPHFAREFTRAGYPMDIVDIHDLKFDGTSLLTKDGTKIDAIYKRVTLDDIKARMTEEGVENLIKAVVAEVVCPIDWFCTQIIHGKQICYMLFHPKTQALLSPSERKFIELHQPKTWKLNNQIASSKWAKSEKDRLIVKPISSKQAINIYPGQDYSEDKWTQILNKCAENGDYILQRYATQYESENVCIDAYDKETSLDSDWKNTNKKYTNMEGLYSYNSKFAGIYLRQGLGSINSRVRGCVDCATYYEEDMGHSAKTD